MHTRNGVDVGKMVGGGEDGWSGERMMARAGASLRGWQHGGPKAATVS